MTTVHDFRVWYDMAFYWLKVGGVLAFVVGLTLERMAKHYNWPTVKRCLPALVVAVLLAVLMAGHVRGVRPTPSTPTLNIVKNFNYQPFCGDIFYYLDFLCWFED